MFLLEWVLCAHLKRLLSVVHGLGWVESLLHLVAVHALYLPLETLILLVILSKGPEQIINFLLIILSNKLIRIIFPAPFFRRFVGLTGSAFLLLDDRKLSL